jgi:hypothetical protein
MPSHGGDPMNVLRLLKMRFALRVSHHRTGSYDGDDKKRQLRQSTRTETSIHAAIKTSQGPHCESWIHQSPLCETGQMETKNSLNGLAYA